MSAQQKEELLKHHHQCVQTLCSVGLCDKSALKRKGLLQLLYLLYSAKIIDKSYYQSLFDCIEQIKESEFTGHMCGANGACSREWKDIIDAFADAVVELKDYNIKVSRHPSKLPPITPEVLDGDFDKYTIEAFQKTPDPKIVENPDFVRGKDLHFRVKQMFDNIKRKFPELQMQQVSILNPPDVVFKREQKDPFMSTYQENQMSLEREPEIGNEEDRYSRVTITKLQDNFDETPRLRSVDSLPELNDRLENKKSITRSLSDDRDLFRASTFDIPPSTADANISSSSRLSSIEGLSIPEELSDKIRKSPTKKKRDRSKLPWWWKSSTAKRPSSKKKSPKKSSKKKSPKKEKEKEEIKTITIRADKDTIERFRNINRKSKKSAPKRTTKRSNKRTKNKSPKKSNKRLRKRTKNKNPKKSNKRSRKLSHKRSAKRSRKKVIKRKK